jgi:hypothetical protein
MKITYQYINVCFIFLIFCLTLEFLARVDDKFKYNAPMFGKYSPDILREYDAERIRHNIPNAQFEKWKINNLGFRGPDIKTGTNVGKIRIVCMGASETFGLYESQNKDWPRQLNEILGDNYDVINTAVVGQFLDKWTVYLDKYVLDLQPEIIIMVVNPFNYVDNISTHNMGDTKKQISQTKQNNKPLNLKKSFINNVKQGIGSLRILPKIKIVIKSVLPQEILKKYQLMAMKNQVIAMERVKLNGQPPADSVAPEAVASFQSDLDTLVKYIKSKHIKVVLSTYPMLLRNENMEDYQDIFYDFRRFYIKLSLKGIIDALAKCNNSIKYVAGENRLDLIDLYRILPHSKIEFGDNVHYTDAGSLAIASSIAEYLRSDQCIHIHK